MCVVSAIHDNWRDGLPQRYPWLYSQPGILPEEPPTRSEVDALRKEVAELKELIRAAQKFDAATGQPECESEDKTAIVRQIEELLERLK